MFPVQDAWTTRCRWCASGRRSTASSLRLDVDRDVGVVSGRRAAVQAGGAQPAVQRRQVHPRRRHGRRAAPRSGADVEVTVTDTGIGVPPEDRERIFESFQQGGRGAPKEEGTGLGLTLSRRIVALFGGRLWLEQRGRRRQHLRLHACRCRSSSRRAARASAAGVPSVLARRRRPGVARPDVGLPRRLVGAGAARPRRRRGARRDRTVAARRPWCSTSGCPGWTAGRC